MNGNTGALTQIWPLVRLGIVCSDKGIPMVTFAAIFARGSPDDLATKGTVLEERGLTSSTYKSSP